MKRQRGTQTGRVTTWPCREGVISHALHSPVRIQSQPRGGTQPHSDQEHVSGEHSGPEVVAAGFVAVNSFESPRSVCLALTANTHQSGIRCVLPHISVYISNGAMFPGYFNSVNAMNGRSCAPRIGVHSENSFYDGTNSMTGHLRRLQQ